MRSRNASQENTAAPNASVYSQAQDASGVPNSSVPSSGNSNYTPASRVVSQQEVSDANRYLRMRQEKERSGLFGRFKSKAASGITSRNTNRSQSGYPSRGSQISRGASRNQRSYAGQNRAGVFASFGAALKNANWHSVAKWASRAVVGVLAAFVIFVFAVSIKMNLGVSLETRTKLSFTLPGQPYYMLLVGTDKSWDRVEAGETTYRTDSIILARVDPLAAKLTLISIQRDTKVELEGYGTQKINAAYALGGAPMLIEAVSELADVPISMYSEIDFDSFVQVVDALGGIEVNVPIDINDEDAHVSLSAGEQTINGEEALGLCRARHAYDSYGSGDYYRTANQRMVLGAILKKGLSGNPFHLVSLIGAVSNSVNSTVTGFDILFLGLRFIGFDMDNNLMSGLEPTTPSYEGGVWYEIVDEDAWTTMLNRVDQGLAPYATEDEDPTAGVAGIT